MHRRAQSTGFGFNTGSRPGPAHRPVSADSSCGCPTAAGRAAGQAHGSRSAGPVRLVLCKPARWIRIGPTPIPGRSDRHSVYAPFGRPAAASRDCPGSDRPTANRITRRTDHGIGSAFSTRCMGSHRRGPPVRHDDHFGDAPDEEAQRLCDRLALIDGGRITALDTPEGLVSHSPVAMTFTPSTPIDDTVLQEICGVTSVHRSGERIELIGNDDAVTSTLDWLAAQGVRVERLRVSETTLEDAYLELTAPSED